MPFVINVKGFAEIPRSAERALIFVTVMSTGTNKAAVSDEVLTTAKHVESLLRELSPQHKTPEAKQAASLAHWSKTTMSATSYVPYDYTGNPHIPRQYNASIKFNIRFKESKALGDFGSRISALQHVEVIDVDWILTAATERSYRAELRKEATRDALQKAHDYCEVLGCTYVRPVELDEGTAMTRAVASTFNANRMGQQAPSYQAMQCAPSTMPSRSANDRRDESPVEFRPEEVRMSMAIDVRFHAE